MSRDWISKCRTCMSTVNGGYQIYDYVESGSRILEMLDTLVPQIRIKDEIMDLSTAICCNCVERITDGYKFLKLCIHTNNNLRLQLVNAQSLEEPPLTIKNETEENVELMIKCENNSEDDCIEDSEEFIETPSNIEKDCLDNRYDYMDINCSNESLKDNYKNTEEYFRTERKMKPSCPPSCKLKCSLQINDKEGSEILLRFRKLGNIEKQRKYIGDHMEAIRPKYRYVTTTSNKKPRGLNNAFYLWVGDRKVRVCKQFFINTLDISERKIRTVMSKKYKSENAVLEEQWKKQGQCHDRLDEYIKDDIKNHIMTRMKINDEDISSQTKRSNYKIIDLHRDYVAHCESRKILSSNYATYDKIFKELNASATKLKRKRIPKYSFK